MVKKAPGIGQIMAMVLFTLSVFGLLLFLWIAFGGTTPLKPQGYRFKAAFPEAALLVNEAEVRMAGIRVGTVKSKELAPGGRRVLATIELDNKFAPIPRDTRAILRQRSLLGETYVALTPGDPESGELADGGTLPDTQIAETVEFEELFSTFDPDTRRAFQEWLQEAGIAVGGNYGQDFNDSLGNLAGFAEAGADLMDPLARQKLALRQVIRDTGRAFGAASEQEGALRGLIVNGNRTFAALASRDEALAQTFEVFPTFERETQATMIRLERFARDTDPLVRLLREPATDLGPTLRDLGDLAPDLEQLFRDVDPLIDASEDGRARRRALPGGRGAGARGRARVPARGQPDPGLPVVQPDARGLVPRVGCGLDRREPRRRLHASAHAQHTRAPPGPVFVLRAAVLHARHHPPAVGPRQLLCGPQRPLAGHRPRGNREL